MDQHQLPVSPSHILPLFCQLPPVRSAVTPAALLVYTADHDDIVLGSVLVVEVTISMTLDALLARIRTRASVR